MKIKMKRGAMTVLFALLGLGTGLARADYAPMKVGNHWTYRGQISESFQYGFSFQDSESLDLKVLSSRKSGDSTYYQVSMKDSLHHRVWSYRVLGHDSAANPADTVFSKVRTWVSLGDHVFIKMEGLETDDIIYPSAYVGGPTIYYPVFENTPFFYNHAAPLAGRQILSGNYTIWETSFNLFNTMSFYWTTWFANDIGMVWAKGDLFAECGPTIRREMKLSTFNGKAVDLGVTPGLPLAKDARIACSIRQRKLGAIRMSVGAEGLQVNALGRIQAPLGNAQVTAGETKGR